MPSSPPVTNALDDVAAEEGCHDTAQTSPLSAIVETAARAAKSQTLIVLSAELSQLIKGEHEHSCRCAYPDRASRPSGDISELRTHEECPVREATAPELGRPDDVVRTSYRIRRLSSEADRRSFSTVKHACDISYWCHKPESQGTMTRSGQPWHATYTWR